MSARKTAVEATAEIPAPIQRPRKKANGPRTRLTHLEVRRGETLRLRIAVADDAIADVGDELGALIKKIAPSTRTSVIAAPVDPGPPPPDPSADLVITRAHADDDTGYHANVREHLVGLIGSLCDTSLADVLEIARNERDRRAEGSN